MKTAITPKYDRQVVSSVSVSGEGSLLLWAFYVRVTLRPWFVYGVNSDQSIRRHKVSFRVTGQHTAAASEQTELYAIHQRHSLACQT